MKLTVLIDQITRLVIAMARYLQYVHVVYDHMSYSVLYKTEAHSESVQDMPENHANIHPKSTYINHILNQAKKKTAT